MDLAVISLILSSVTAVAAVISPVISSIISIKSGEKMKQLELYSPQIYDAVDRMLQTYSKLPSLDDFLKSPKEDGDRLLNQYQTHLKEFTFACYDTITLISDQTTQTQLIEFLGELRSAELVNDDINAKFEGLIVSISSELSTCLTNGKKSKPSKKKTTDSK